MCWRQRCAGPSASAGAKADDARELDGVQAAEVYIRPYTYMITCMYMLCYLCYVTNHHSYEGVHRRWEIVRV